MDLRLSLRLHVLVNCFALLCCFSVWNMFDILGENETLLGYVSEQYSCPAVEWCLARYVGRHVYFDSI